MYLISRRTALITGASRGIGRAIAVKLAKKDYNVAINCVRGEEQLMRIQKEIGSFQVPYLVYKGGMRDMACCKGLFLKIKKMFGGMDVPANNAGTSYIGLLQDMSTEDQERMLRTNLTSVFNCCKLTVPYMVSQEQGEVVNISSAWGVVGASCETAYSTTKSGINALIKALAKGLAPSSIQVSAITYGAIDTKMNQQMGEGNLIALVDEIPSGRLGRAEEVADLVCHLGYEESYLTGRVIGPDGGWIQAGGFKPRN